jgi:drug/metabolite transporter (DMT)-like permease
MFAACSIVAFPLLMTIAMRYAPASHGAVVLAVLPLLTAMAGAAVAGERPSLGFWACGVAGTGAAFAYAMLSGAGTGDAQWADLLLAGAALAAATAYALGGELTRRIGGWEVISWALVFSSPVMLALVLMAAPINWGASAAAWAGFLYVSVFSQFLGFFAWNKGLAMGGIARISQMQLLQPFVSLIAAWALLGEHVGWLEIAFALLVVALVALSWRMRIARPRDE